MSLCNADFDKAEIESETGQYHDISCNTKNGNDFKNQNVCHNKRISISYFTLLYKFEKER